MNLMVAVHQREGKKKKKRTKNVRRKRSDE